MKISEKGKGWLSTTTNWMKKQYFNGAHFIDTLTNDENAENIYLFGIPFSENKEARIVYNSVFWFTYRQNIEFKSYPEVTSDVGWGCMIRVGQMMLAQTLRIHAGRTLYHDENYCEKILKEFINKEGVFSLQNLAMVGEEKIGKKPGEWYSPSEIAFVLREQCEFAHTNFKVLVMDSEFELTSSIKELSDSSSAFSSALIIILTRIGYTKPEEQYLQTVIELLKQEASFIGILGGRPGKAHYIFGTTDTSFIYLDPHCVKVQKNIESFFSDKIFSIAHDKIDPSMGLCFYVKNISELVLLNEKLSALNKSLPVYSHSKEDMNIIEEEEEFIVL